jgi:hypothetical protein
VETLKRQYFDSFRVIIVLIQFVPKRLGAGTLPVSFYNIQVDIQELGCSGVHWIRELDVDPTGEVL